MTVMLCRNRVADYSTWKAVFDLHAPESDEAGLTLTNMWHDVDDPNNVFFLFEVANLERARAFINNPTGAEVGRKAGVIEGEYHFLTRSPASKPVVEPLPTCACAWCGEPVSEDGGFLLRVGARLCHACAEQAGRIVAEQRTTDT